MLDQASLKLKDFPIEFTKNVKLINSSVSKLSTHNTDEFDLIISTRFLPHFSILESENIMNILKRYAKEDLVIMVRVSDKKLSIFFEILDLLIRSPLGAIKDILKQVNYPIQN